MSVRHEDKTLILYMIGIKYYKNIDGLHNFAGQKKHKNTFYCWHGRIIYENI